MSNLPSWVKPNALALHNGTLFTVQKVQKSRTGGRYFLSPWGNGAGIVFPLSECQVATPDAVPQQAEFLTPNGHRLRVERIPIGFAVSDSTRRIGVSLQEDGLAAAESLARAFDGEVVEVDDDNW